MTAYRSCGEYHARQAKAWSGLAWGFAAWAVLWLAWTFEPSLDWLIIGLLPGSVVLILVMVRQSMRDHRHEKTCPFKAVKK